MWQCTCHPHCPRWTRGCMYLLQAHPKPENHQRTTQLNDMCNLVSTVHFLLLFAHLHTHCDIIATILDTFAS